VARPLLVRACTKIDLSEPACQSGETADRIEPEQLCDEAERSQEQRNVIAVQKIRDSVAHNGRRAVSTGPKGPVAETRRPTRPPYLQRWRKQKILVKGFTGKHINAREPNRAVERKGKITQPEGT